MATLLAMLGGAAINALAFSGTNFLFSKLSDHGAAERKRHDLAIEKLQKARDEYAKQRQKRLDYYNKVLREEAHSREVFNSLDQAAEEYYLLTKKPRLPPLREPKLSDYYHPSELQKDGEFLFIATALGLGCYLAYKYV